MNLALTLFLAQKVWSPSMKHKVIEDISNKYLEHANEIFVFHGAAREDVLAEQLLGDLHRRGDVLVSHYPASEGADPPPFVEPHGILLFADLKQESYLEDVLSFIVKIIANIGADLKLVVVTDHERGLADDDVLLIFDNLRKVNVANVLLVDSITGTTPPGLVIYRRRSRRKRDTDLAAGDVLKVDLSQADALLSLPDDAFSILDSSRDITGSCLNVSVALTPPYVWLATNDPSDDPPGKLYEDLKTEKLAGIEVAILEEFRDKHELLGYYIIHPSEMMDVGNFENKSDGYGVLEETALGISDVAIGGNLATPDLYTYFVPSASYFEDSIYWYVPSAREIPRWKNIFAIFDGCLWSLVFLALATASVAFYAIAQRGSEKDFSAAVLSAWATILSQPASQTLSARAKPLFLATLLYGMHISAFYRSGLFRSLSDGCYEAPIASVEEATTLELCLSGSTYDFYSQQDFDAILGNNFSYSAYLDRGDCLRRVAVERDSFALLPEKATDFAIALDYLDEARVPMAAKIPKKLMRYPVSMYLTKASPFREPLDFVATRLLESGIIGKWWKDIRSGSERRQTERGYKSISLENAAGMFLAWLIFAVASGAVFACELGCYRQGTRDSE